MPIYVGTNPDSVTVYDDTADGDASPIRTIQGPSTGLNGVSDVKFDSAGNLYVANSAGESVTVYAPGADGDAAPIRTIRGTPPVGALAFDSAENLYVLGGGASPGILRVYSSGADGDAVPIRTITDIGPAAGGNLWGVAIDSSDFLYIAHDGRRIIVYAPGADGAALPFREITGLPLLNPFGVTFDDADNLYVANGSNVLVYPPGGSSPIHTIPAPAIASDVAVDTAGLLYTASFSPPDYMSPMVVTVWAAGADSGSAPLRTITGPDTGLGIITGGIAIGPPVVLTQDNWRWCNQCQALFYAGDTTKGVCPAGTGGHNYSGSGNYKLQFAPAAGQDNWRWCYKCEVLFFAGDTTTGVCAAGGRHDYTRSGDYVLALAPGTGQDNWRWCNRCESLFYAGNTTTGWCPLGGGHDYGGSGDYVLTS